MLKKMTKKQKKQFYKIVVAFVLLIVGVILPIPELYKLIFFIPGYLIVGYDVLAKAGKNITKGQVFDENFLMAIATIGAFALQEYTEGIAVMLFYQVGELFQSYAVNQSRKSVASLMDIRPDSAVVLRDGVEEEVFPDEVAVGETIIVKPGERIPLDGIVLEGSSMEDTKALTGEAVPRKVSVGDEIISGCINLTNILKIRTTKEYGESTVARILDLVENASSQKAKVENFITKFARYYTPIVVGLAAFIGLIVPIFLLCYSVALFAVRFALRKRESSGKIDYKMAFVAAGVYFALLISEADLSVGAFAKAVIASAYFAVSAAGIGFGLYAAVSGKREMNGAGKYLSLLSSAFALTAAVITADFVGKVISAAIAVVSIALYLCLRLKNEEVQSDNK